MSHPLNGLDVDVSGQHVKYGERSNFGGGFGVVTIFSQLVSQNPATINAKLTRQKILIVKQLINAHLEPSVLRLISGFRMWGPLKIDGDEAACFFILK